VFEDRVLRRMFGPMKEEAKGGRIKLHNDEFHNLFAPTIIKLIKIKENEMGKACGTHGGERNFVTT
jgi:hypothetical protein